jgi:methylmalonyl-CoA/ethylmalonyl-CoA epimerase
MTEPIMPLTRRIDHIGVAVESINASLPYYVDVLGMTVSLDVVLGDGSTRLAYLEAGDTTLQLVQPLVPGALADFLADRGEGPHHVCFAVNDIVEALGRLPGGEPTSGIYVGGRRCRVSFINGHPNGLTIELTEQEPWVAPEPMPELVRAPSTALPTR